MLKDGESLDYMFWRFDITLDKTAAYGEIRNNSNKVGCSRVAHGDSSNEIEESTTGSGATSFDLMIV